MFPPIFEYVSVDSDVQTNIGSSPCRLYPFGEAPQNVAKPYAVWQTTSGNPENYLDKVPDTDTWTIQLDVYGDSVLQVHNAAQAIRDAIEPLAHILDMGGQGRDPDTNNYRYTMTIDWIYNRSQAST